MKETYEVVDGNLKIVSYGDTRNLYISVYGLIEEAKGFENLINIDPENEVPESFDLIYDDNSNFMETDMRGIIEGTNEFVYFKYKEMSDDKDHYYINDRKLIGPTITRKIAEDIYVGDIVQNEFGLKLLTNKDFLSFVVAYELKDKIKELPFSFLDERKLCKVGDIFIDNKIFVDFAKRRIESIKKIRSM